MKMTKVLIVDDSASVRSILRTILERDPYLTVCGEAADPFEARKAIKELLPDVITLDVEMPRMNGLLFLKNLMRLHPIPTIMVSSLTVEGNEASIEALCLGAVDFVHKPKANEIDSVGKEIVSKIKVAAQANVASWSSQYSEEISQYKGDAKFKFNRLIALGASTGGIPAVERILSSLPINCPPTVVVQHIQDSFSAVMAARMNSHCAINISEARDAQPLEVGHAYMAPGGQHMEVRKAKNGYYLKLHTAEPVHFVRPSVDVLFNSVVEAAQGNASAALLTGMGKDGAAGLLNMKNRGCFTVIQDEASSIVWGMPGAAAELNAGNKILALDLIAAEILDSCCS